MSRTESSGERREGTCEVSGEVDAGIDVLEHGLFLDLVEPFPDPFQLFPVDILIAAPVVEGDAVGQDVDAGDGIVGVPVMDLLVHLRIGRTQFAVGLVLEFQAAHELVAGSGKLRDVDGQKLILRHGDGNAVKGLQKSRTAKRKAAGADAADKASLIPRPDLPQFDSETEHAVEDLDQFAEIHPALGGEGDEDLVVVDVKMGGVDLHLQIQVVGLLLRLAADEPFLFARLCREGLVLKRGDADDRREKRRKIGFGHFFVGRFAFLFDFAKVGAVARLADDQVADLDVLVRLIEGQALEVECDSQ